MRIALLAASISFESCNLSLLYIILGLLQHYKINVDPRKELLIKFNIMNIIKITDTNIPELDIYTRIPERQLLTINEPAPGLFIAESFKVLERALNAEYKPVSAVVEDKCLEEFEALISKMHSRISGPNALAGMESAVSSPAASAVNAYSHNTLPVDFPVFTASSDVLDSITGYHLTGGCLCAMKRKELSSPIEILRSSKRIALLENIMNPTNVGAIFRSAAALGMDAVLLTRSCSDPLYRRAIRVSMGTVFQIPWAFVDYWNVSGTGWRELNWPEEGISLLHEHGFKLASMALRNESISIGDLRLKGEDRLVVALGSEGEGLLTKTIDMSDYVVKIPMAHEVDSLNVAAASALAFWELGR